MFLMVIVAICVVGGILLSWWMQLVISIGFLALIKNADPTGALAVILFGLIIFIGLIMGNTIGYYFDIGSLKIVLD